MGYRLMQQLMVIVISFLSVIFVLSVVAAFSHDKVKDSGGVQREVFIFLFFSLFGRPQRLTLFPMLGAWLSFILLFPARAEPPSVVDSDRDLSELGLVAHWPVVDEPLEIASSKLTAMSTDTFSIAMWVRSDEIKEQLGGDLLSHYDPAARRGFHLTLKSNLGVTSNQANWRQLQFGIDDDRISQWSDCGRPGNALFAFSMAEHQGKLFVGTCEPGREDRGRVYQYRGAGAWQDCQAPVSANSITAMAEFRGELYVATGRYRVAGSSLPESENMTPGGQILRYARDGSWIDCGQLPEVEAVGGLVVYQGKLYASSLYHPAGFFRWDGQDGWTELEVPTASGSETGESVQQRVVAMTVFDGHLYATSYDSGHVYRFDGQSWMDCGLVGDNTQTYAFTSYRGLLHVATWPSGRVFRMQSPGKWVDTGRLGQELEVMGMIVHNGRLMAGTLPLAQVYSYQGARGQESDGWLLLGQLDATPEVRYRRAWTMAEHDGQLFCSTLPSGRIFSISAGFQVSHGQPLTSGWHHIVATRSESGLSLYLDGKLVQKKLQLGIADLQLNSSVPWRIGSGMNGSFLGKMRDVRLYSRAVTPEEVIELYNFSRAHP